MNRLIYSVDLSYEIVDQTADFIFNIEVAKTERQAIIDEHFTITPGIEVERYTDPVLANRMMRVRAPKGPLNIHYDATVDIDHRLDNPADLLEVPIAKLPFDVLPFLAPSRYCQSDRLAAYAFALFGHLPQGYSRARAVCDWVQQHVQFRSNSSSGTTSAIDTLVERVGVCRDFAHLMIAMCRAINLPARFVTGTDYGADPALGPPDFHAYVEVYLGGRWYLFDPSGTAIPMGMMRLATGRDAADAAFATIFGGVYSEPPRIEVVAEQNGLQWQLPVHTAQGLSTALV